MSTRSSAIDNIASVAWIDTMDPSDAPHWPARVPEYHLVRPIIGSAPNGRRDAGGPATATAGPQAYVVENGSARRTLRIHFHLVDQFQLAVDGDATIGRSALRGGVVHYADRHTPYGPLRYGEPGLAYLTLRAATDTGASYMPDASDELATTLQHDTRDASARRNLTFDLGGLPARPGDGWFDVMAADDGLRIGVVDLRAGDRATPITVDGEGAYTVVLSGTVDDGRPHGLGALVWCPAGTSAAVVAGSDGARIALLQLPRSGARHVTPVPTNGGGEE